MQYQQAYAQSSQQARAYPPSLQPGQYHPGSGSLPPITPTQAHTNSYYSAPSSAPSQASRQIPVSPGAPPFNKYGYYTPQAGVSSTPGPLPSPHLYPSVHPHHRFQSQLSGQPPLSQPPPHTLEVKQEPAPYRPAYPTPARRPSPPRLQVQIHPPSNIGAPPQPPKHGSSGPYTLTANFGALGLDTYATTPFPQPPPSPAQASPIQPVGTYQPPRPLPKPITIPSASVQPYTQYGAVPQSAPPAFSAHFTPSGYTSRYAARMGSSQQSNGTPDKYGSVTPVVSHAQAPQPGSANCGERYADQSQASQQHLMVNTAPAPPLPLGMVPTTSQYPADYSEYAAPISTTHSIGPTLISVLESSQMRGDPETPFWVKCQMTLPSESSVDSRKGSAHFESDKPLPVIRLAFAEEACQTNVTHIEERQAGISPHTLMLKCTIPAWSKVAMHSSAAQVPVRIEVMLHGEVESYLNFGQFKYDSFNTASRVPTYQNYQPTELLAHNPLKRGGEYLESDRAAPNGSQPMHRRVASTGMVKHEPDGRLQYEQPMISPTEYVAPSSYPLDDKHSVAMQVSFSQPNLQRSTQIPGVIPISSAYSPVAKASLDLGSDLGNMARGWSQEEWADRRRLVQFWRRQTGTSITAICHPVSQAKWLEESKKSGGGIVVSCIYREETNMCYVTSVDAIYLLEALVGNRFTVEEKNRIRRNLEGFRPITVSKNKAGSEDFFKLIMSFPNPKPRNIEKDVKVFPWDVLGQALKKIISKYSAAWQTGSPSPALSASSQLPPFSAPYSSAPTPLMPMDPTPPEQHEYYVQQPAYPHEQVYDSAPPGLTSGPSTDSLAYPQSTPMYSIGGPQTPHMPQHMQPNGGPNDVYAHQAPYSEEYKGYAHEQNGGLPDSPTRYTTAYGQPTHINPGDYRPSSDPTSTSHKSSMSVPSAPLSIDPALANASALGLHDQNGMTGGNGHAYSTSQSQSAATADNSPARTHGYNSVSGPASAAQNHYYDASAEPISPTPAYDHGTYAPMISYSQSTDSGLGDAGATHPAQMQAHHMQPPPMFKGQTQYDQQLHDPSLSHQHYQPQQQQQQHGQHQHQQGQQQLGMEGELTHSRQTSADLRVMYPTMPTARQH